MNMNEQALAQKAAQWALGKVGCTYSQEKRTQENIFDCSSLVARAYSAQGKRWKYGGSVPLSNQEVYDDDFELLWPADYASIGKQFGSTTAISAGKRAGDLQFLCTDSKTSRVNRITHVAMVTSESQIVHARGKAYGVCTNAISLYSGKVCAVTRYNPSGTLRTGMKGFRTLQLQQALNALGASLTADGDYGSATASAVKAYQMAQGFPATGQADPATLKLLNLLSAADEGADQDGNSVRKIQITGGTVNIRSGPGTEYPSVGIARKGEEYETVDVGDWIPIRVDGEIRWISGKYSLEI